MDHAEHRRRQAGILDEVLGVLEDEPEVLGVVAAGLHARGNHDAFSDIDLACFFKGEERTRREAVYDRIGELAPLLSKLWLYDVHALYLFEDGVRLDLDLYRKSDIAKGTFNYADIAILYDPHGALSQLPEGGTPEPAEHPRRFMPGEDALLGWFFWMFRQAVCWARRGEQRDERAYDKLAGAVDSLAQVRTRLVEMRQWTLGTREYLGRADPECARRLTQTYPTLSSKSIIACARLLLDEYERVVGPYCLKAGAEPPARRIACMQSLITEFERLD